MKMELALIRRAVVTVLVLVLAVVDAATAQNGDALHMRAGGPGSTRLLAGPDGTIQRAPVPVYLKENKTGEFIHYPGLSVEDLDKYLEDAQALGAERRIVTDRLEVLAVRGEVAPSGRFASFTVEATVIARETGALLAPLDLREGALSVDKAESEPLIMVEGASDASLHFGEFGEPGYVLVFQEDGLADDSAAEDASSERTYRVSFDLLIPISQSADERSLKISFPRSSVASEFQLDVPIANATVRATESTLVAPPRGSETVEATGSPKFTSKDVPLEVVTPVPGDGSDDETGGTRLTANGVRGVLEVRWAPPSVSSDSAAVLLKVERARIEATLDNRSADLNVVLPIRSYGGPFRKCSIRLPYGSQWSTIPSNAYKIQEVMEESSAGGEEPAPPRGPLLEVTLSAETAAPIEIAFRVKQSLEARGEDGWFELAAFDVQEAEEQWGDITVQTVGDWRVEWGVMQGVRRTDRVQEIMEKPSLTGRFEYYLHPCSLPARLVPRRMELNVQPSHYILVDIDSAKLHSFLSYTVHGKPADQLEIDMRGWQFVSAGPDNIVDVDRISRDESGRVMLPLSHPSTAPMQIEIQARKRLSTNLETVSFRPPLPRADWVKQATIAVQPDSSNIELTPRVEEMHGLVEIRRPSAELLAAIDASPRQQPPLCYRGAADEAVFVADVSHHSQEISVEVSTEVDLLAAADQIEQTFRYDIRYEAVDRLALRIPRSITDAGGLTLFLDGQILPQSSIEPVGVGTVNMAERRVTLPTPRIGACVLTARYDGPSMNPQPRMSAFGRAPLIMPADGRLVSNQLTIHAPASVEVHPDDASGVWRAVEGLDRSNDDENKTSLRLRASGPVSDIAITASLRDETRFNTVTVERAWYQTWIGAKKRRDRIVLRFRSSLDSFELKMPDGIDVNSVQVRLDGEAAARLPEDDRLIVSLSGMDSDERHTLDLWYFQPMTSEGTRLDVEFPRLPDNAWVRRSYWQLVLPNGSHLLSGPEGLTPEFRWEWQGAFFGRASLLEQEDLESWSGATRDDPIPSGASRYLFGTLGPIEHATVRSANRTYVVLIASAAALAIGLLLVYVAPARSPVVLLTGVILFVMAATTRPAPTLLLAQASSLGVIAALLAALLHRSVTRHRRWRANEPNSSLFVSDHGSQSFVSRRRLDAESESAVALSTSDIEQ